MSSFNKGFPRIKEDCQNRGAFLVMPSFNETDKQFSEEDNENNYLIAKLRVHVERCIKVHTHLSPSYLFHNLNPFTKSKLRYCIKMI